jgi:hypothetical protein
MGKWGFSLPHSPPPPEILEKSSVDLLVLGFSIIFASISLNFGIFFSEFAIKSIVSISLHQFKP